MNHKAFDADLERFDTAFRRLDAVKRGREADGSTFLYLDTDRIPGPMLSAYRRLVQSVRLDAEHANHAVRPDSTAAPLIPVEYGYATGLLS